MPEKSIVNSHAKKLNQDLFTFNKKKKLKINLISLFTIEQFYYYYLHIYSEQTLYDVHNNNKNNIRDLTGRESQMLAHDTLSLCAKIGYSLLLTFQRLLHE